MTTKAPTGAGPDLIRGHRIRFLPQRQGFDATVPLFYEAPSGDPDHLEVWCYTDRLSYAPGDFVAIHLSSSAARVRIEIVHDALAPRTVYAAEVTAPGLHALPDDFLANGCNWPCAHTWRVPDETPSGFYLLIATATAADGEVRIQEHGFFVRRRANAPKAPILLVAATSTWIAYNDWGGGNNYISQFAPDGLPFSPRLSWQRPFGRGMLRIPRGAPRKTDPYGKSPGSLIRYPPIEFAYTRGYCKWYSSAGWALFERPFAHWAERAGFRLDFATQADLHQDPALLEGYTCVAFVGHDEYWSWEMRDRVEAYVDAGGRVARFAGNFMWQVRLEDHVQISFKDFAPALDPEAADPASRRIAAHWAHPRVARPGAETFGLNGEQGVYALAGGMMAHAPGGFTVYRPEHWVFAGSGLGYGDMFGAQARIFGYEVDGLDYTFRDGLPTPTFADGARPDIEIIAMGLASNTEPASEGPWDVRYYGDAAPPTAALRYGSTAPDRLDAARRGSGMIVTYRRGAGEVFHAGSCEWVAGLDADDPMTSFVTRRVLDRYTSR